MSFANKSNGREYVNKSSSNIIRGQTMSYRNSVTNTQYSNSSNGESYSYDEKSQHSPKVVSESHATSQHNSCSRDSYSYKNNNSRIKPYHQSRNYNDRYNNFFNQRSGSPDEAIIPEIDQLRAFIVEQTELFKKELSRHEYQKSNSSTTIGHSYDQSNKYNKNYGSLGRSANGLPASHSLGSISNNNTNAPTGQTSSVSPSGTDSSNRHPDARMNHKNTNNNNYNKHSSNSGKPGLTRYPSHEDTFSKTLSTINRNGSDSPNNHADKSVNNKVQFPSPTGSLGGRHESKKAFCKPNVFASGPAPVTHQNNLISTMVNVNEVVKNDHQQQGRPTINSAPRNGYTNGMSKTVNRRRVDNRGDCDSMPSYRAVVSVADTGARRVSNSGSSTIDSPDVNQSVTDTPTVPEQFFTPDPSASPCSTRSSPDAAPTTHFQFPRGQRKAGNLVVNTRTANKINNNNHE